MNIKPKSGKSLGYSENSNGNSGDISSLNFKHRYFQDNDYETTNYPSEKPFNFLWPSWSSFEGDDEAFPPI